MRAGRHDARGNGKRHILRHGRLAAPADEPFEILFNNQDQGLPHNVAIYTDSSAAEVLFQGETFAGPDEQTYQVDPLQAGDFFFRCDVHPTQMTGTFVVAEEGGGVAERQAETAAAEGSRSTFPAGSPGGATMGG